MNKRPRWPWIEATAILFPVLYAWTFGPACWLVSRHWLPVETTAWIYWPVFMAELHAGAFANDCIFQWGMVWGPKGFVWMLAIVD